MKKRFLFLYSKKRIKRQTTNERKQTKKKEKKKVPACCFPCAHTRPAAWSPPRPLASPVCVCVCVCVCVLCARVFTHIAGIAFARTERERERVRE